MPIWSTKKWNIANLKRDSIPEDLKGLALFSDLQYSLSKCSKIACKVSQYFLAERCEDLCECERALAKPVPPPPTQHYLSMAYSLPRLGGLGKIYRWGRGASVVKNCSQARGNM